MEVDERSDWLNQRLIQYSYQDLVTRTTTVDAENQTSEIGKAPKAEQMLVRISDVWISDIWADRTTQTSLNVQKSDKLDHFIYNFLHIKWSSLVEMYEIRTFELVSSRSFKHPKSEQIRLDFRHFRKPNIIAPKLVWSVRNPNTFGFRHSTVFQIKIKRAH